MDQLQEAPTAEITSFIVWYMWTCSIGILLGTISHSCFCGTLKLVTTLFIPASVSLALCLDSFFRHWLVVEPVGRNPYKLFFGVLRYAVKNKYPRQRSAFTYWEDKPYSRIDLAKDKYGGPFNTEQVEDVKTVLRISAMLIVAFLGVGLSFSLAVIYDVKVFDHLTETSLQPCGSETLQACVQLMAVKNFRFAVVVFIPIHEFVVYPIFWKYVIQIKSVVKFTFGLFHLVLQYSSLLVIEAVGFRYTALPDGTATCFVNKESSLLSLSFKWYCIPEFFKGLSLLYLSWGSIEFICSQAPCTMKGLLLGIVYFLLGLWALLTSLLLLPIPLTVEKWHPVLYGCGVWFYACVTLFFLGFTLLFIILFKKVYKMRRRDEDLHNRHIFAINYYSHYVQYNKELQTDHEPE